MFTSFLSFLCFALNFNYSLSQITLSSTNLNLSQHSFLGQIQNSSTRKLIGLNGTWTYEVNSQTGGVINIPTVITGVSPIVLKKTFNLSVEDIFNSSFHLVAVGINYYCEIELNNLFIGKHAGGSPFVIKISDHVLKVGENTLEILVKNNLNPMETIPLLEQNYDPPNYGGIFRAISIVATQSVWTENINLQSNVQAEGKLINLNYSTTLSSGNVGKLRTDSVANKLTGQKIIVEHYFEIIDKNTGTITCRSETRKVEIESDRLVTVNISATLSEGKLWSPSIPYLYTLRAVSMFNGKVVDECSQIVGFRKIEIKGKNIFLNNEKIFIQGVTYREYSPQSGISASDDDLEKDVILMKNLGANAVRVLSSAINPALITLCDKYGILVFCDLPLWNVPSSILEYRAIQSTAKNILQEYSSVLNNHPSLVGWGLSAGIDGTSEGFGKFIASVAQTINTPRSQFFYASFSSLGSLPIPKELDFIALDIQSTKTEEVKNFLLNGSSLFQHYQKPILIGALGHPIQVGNYNGYSDPRSVDSQGQFFLELFPIILQTGYPGVFVHSFSDWRTAKPIMNQDIYYQYLATVGIVDQFRQKRIAYDVVKAYFNNEKNPSLAIGTSSEIFPPVFIIVGLVALFLFASVYNLSRRFRENVVRSLLRPFNFFTDIRDQRILSLLQTTIIGAICSISVGLLTTNVLFYWKSNYWFDVILSQFIRPPWLKELFIMCGWYPLVGISLFALVCFVVVGLYSLILKVLSLFIRRRILIFDTYSVSMWSLIPMMFFVPVGMILHRVMSIPFIELIAVILAIVFFLWTITRLLKGTAILFDVRPLYLLTSGYFVLVAVLVFWVLTLQDSYRIIDYIEYTWKVSTFVRTFSQPI